MPMELFKDRLASPTPLPGSATRPMFWALVLLSLVPLCVVMPMTSTKVGVAVLTAWVALIWVAISFARDQFHYVVPVWVAVYPYCYYLFSYPAERSIFTIDRALVLLLAIEIVLAERKPLPPLTKDVRVSACLWGVYLLLCFLSLLSHPTAEVLPSYRFLMDGMLMPAVLGLYAMRYFPLVQDLRKLHICACILGLGLFLTGLVEVTTGIDLFPLSGSVPIYTDTHLRRADGPFEQQVILTMVAILAFFFILFLGRLQADTMSPRRRFLHKAACLAALCAALLPLNRGLIVALAPIAAIDCWAKQRLLPRRLWAAFFSIVLLSMIGTRLLNPRLYEDRVSNPDNVYQRLAQHEETLRVIREYPFFGVGFGLYHDVASRNPRYMAKYNGIESMNVPHNALMTVLSEGGLVGLLVYLLAQAFLLRAMWGLRAAYPPGWLAFVYCIVVYVMIGLDYAIVSIPDINLFYLFILGIIYQLQIRMAEASQTSSLLTTEARAG
jgi:O-antigen ligase